MLENQSNELAPVKKSNKLRNGLIGGGAIAAVVIGAGVIGINYANNGSESADVPATSAPVDPTESATPESPSTTGTLTVESLRLDPNASAQELGLAVGTLFSNWSSEGADIATADLSLDSSLSVNEFAAEEAKKNAAIYAEAIYGPGWENNADIVFTVNFYIEQNRNIILSSWATLDEATPFTWNESVDSVVVISDDGSASVVEVTSTTTNNGSKNDAGIRSPGLEGLNGQIITKQYSLARSTDAVYVTGR